jgi:outer membrane biogenesis lipoprotein LolB
MVNAGTRLLSISLVLLIIAGCAGKRIALPTDQGTLLSDYEAVFTDVSSSCRNVQTLTAELSLSGRAAGEKLRGTLQAGFKTPASMRLELRVGPFGSPVFVLAADGERATLLLPRDNQVVRGERGEEILGALTGIMLAPADLLAILTGCVVPSPRATGGRLHSNGWATIQLADGATLYVQRLGSHWRVRAAQRGDWRIDYTGWPESATFPTRVQLQATRPVVVDLRAALSQPDATSDLGPDVFVVKVPPDAEVISLEQLRRAGPLKEQ